MNMPARKRAKGKARKAAKANKVLTLTPETETKKNDDTAAKQKDSEQQLHELIQGLTLSNKCKHGQLPLLLIFAAASFLSLEVFYAWWCQPPARSTSSKRMLK